MKRNKMIYILLSIFIFTMSFITFKSYKASYRLEKDNKIISNYKYKDKEEIGQEYYKSDRIVQGLKVVYSLAVPSLILITGFSAKMRNYSNKIARNSFISIGIYGILYNFSDTFLSFPLSYYSGYIQTHVFGISHQPFFLWIKNYFIGFIISCITIFLILWIPYKIIEKSPKRWWVYTGLISIPFILFMYLAQPVVIDPLFNKFKPIEDKNIEISLKELTRRAKIQNCNILTIDKSKETHMINAYMTGIGNSKRIVLWDTALNKLNLKELRFIMAHEIGHYVLGHTKQLIVLNIIVIFIILYTVHVVSPFVINKFSNKFKFNNFKDVASFPLIIFIMNIYLLVIIPSFNAYSCYMERQADTFAIELTKDNKSALSSFEKLSKDGIVIPKPGSIYKLWKYDHPPIKDRMDFFKSYMPWKEGTRLKYDKYIN